MKKILVLCIFLNISAATAETTSNCKMDLMKYEPALFTAKGIINMNEFSSHTELKNDQEKTWGIQSKSVLTKSISDLTNQECYEHSLSFFKVNAFLAKTQTVFAAVYDNSSLFWGRYEYSQTTYPNEPKIIQYNWFDHLSPDIFQSEKINQDLRYFNEGKYSKQKNKKGNLFWNIDSYPNGQKVCISRLYTKEKDPIQQWVTIQESKDMCKQFAINWANGRKSLLQKEGKDAEDPFELIFKFVNQPNSEFKIIDWE